MKRITVVLLVLMVCAVPAFGWHKKPRKDPRIVDHPKAHHQQNPYLKHPVKHKTPKHKA